MCSVCISNKHFEWRKMTRNNLWQGQVFCVSLHKVCRSHGVLSFVQIIHWCVWVCYIKLGSQCSHFVLHVVNGNRLMRFSGSNEYKKKLLALVSVFAYKYQLIMTDTSVYCFCPDTEMGEKKRGTKIEGNCVRKHSFLFFFGRYNADINFYVRTIYFGDLVYGFHLIWIWDIC